VSQKWRCDREALLARCPRGYITLLLLLGCVSAARVLGEKFNPLVTSESSHPSIRCATKISTETHRRDLRQIWLVGLHKAQLRFGPRTTFLQGGCLLGSLNFIMAFITAVQGARICCFVFHVLWNATLDFSCLDAYS
jgi:hypothetical protein